MDDIDLAVALSGIAGAVLRRLSRSGLWRGAELGRLGDRISDEVILAGLRRHRRSDAILSEEGRSDSTRLSHHRVWIVDPLDGTIEFGEKRSDWAVQIGLAIDGRAALGVVALPAQGVLLRSDQPPPLPSCRARPRLVVSRSHRPPNIGRLAEALNAELIPMGSVGAKVAAILEGRAEAYIHYGGQYEWDNCAPGAIARAAGLHVSRASGAALIYNQVNPLLPDLIICHPTLANALHRAFDRTNARVTRLESSKVTRDRRVRRSTPPIGGEPSGAARR
jgi:3'(2'), 5'-bisphosphate nucleotidase